MIIASLRLPGLVRDSATVGLGLGLVKAAGAIKVVFMARAFGASDDLDAYLVAFLLPSFASEVVVGSFSSALVPALISLRERRGNEVKERIRANLLAALVTALTIAGLLLWLASPWLLRLMAADFGSAKLALARGLFTLLLPILPLNALSSVWRATLNSEERFTAAALAPVATPALTVILLSVMGAQIGIWMLAAAHLAGMALELVWLAIVMRQRGIGLLPSWTGWDPEMRQVVFQHLPLVAVAVGANGGILIDQSMAATLASGSVSALNYGTKLATVSAGVVGGALSTAALPRFAKMAAAENWPGLRATILQYAQITLFAVLPGTLILIALSEFLVRFVFQRGAMTESSAQLITSVQRWSLLQLPPAVFAGVLFRLISSLQSTHLLMRVAALGMALNILLDVALKQIMGLPGIALSSAIVQLATAAYALLLVKGKMPSESSGWYSAN